jgi:hypothetical protein
MTRAGRPTLTAVDIQRARFLVSPAAAEMLAALEAEEGSRVALHTRIQRLRTDLAGDEASAISEQLEIRARARERFGNLAPHWRGTREGLEMATHPIVAERRARRLATLDLPVIDLTCGVGGDLVAFAQQCRHVLGLERDAATAFLAAHNVDGKAWVVRGDAARPPLQLSNAAAFLDPSRRAGGLRRFSPREFTPPWDMCLHLLETAAPGALKGPPGIPDAAIPPAAEVEFVQLGRSLREAALYLGGNAQPGVRRAVLLPAGDELCNRDPSSAAVASGVGEVLYDPASCVTRAGLVQQLAHRLEATLLDSRIAYLTSDSARDDPLADAFQVLQVVPFSLARLRTALRANTWRPTEIRRRAFPIEPDALRKQLGRIDGAPVTLLCTTIANKRLIVVAKPF